MGYTKLFSEIVASSIWEEDNETRLVWITMLALKDRTHYVRGTESYLGRVARVSVEDCSKALRKLSRPDPHSRSTEHEGRRIQEVPGGWLILNGERYQKMLSYEERKEYNCQKQAEYRRRKKDLRTQAQCDGAQAAIVDGFEEARRLRGSTPDLR